MAGRTILIVGASRGLGHALAAEFVERGWHVIGTVRSGGGTPLHALADAHPGQVEIETLDVDSPDQIAALRDRLSERTIDILFVNAGIAARAPRARLEAVEADEFSRIMLTNVHGPMRVIAALGDRVPDDGLIGAMSSGQGSIANNTDGNNDVYRASKSALNMMMRSFSVRPEQQHRAFMLLSPGWIRTEMGGDKAPYTVDESAPILADRLLEKRGNPGLHYVDRFGATVPW